MDDNTCRTCEYWCEGKDEVVSDHQSPNYLETIPNPHPNRGKCYNTEVPALVNPGPPRTWLMFIPHADYGCRLHKPKEADDGK